MESFASLICVWLLVSYFGKCHLFLFLLFFYFFLFSATRLVTGTACLRNESINHRGPFVLYFVFFDRDASLLMKLLSNGTRNLGPVLRDGNGYPQAFAPLSRPQAILFLLNFYVLPLSPSPVLAQQFQEAVPLLPNVFFLRVHMSFGRLLSHEFPVCPFWKNTEPFATAFCSWLSFPVTNFWLCFRH